MEKTKHRGFLNYYSFTDVNGQQCSISESSVATDNYIWLGVEGKRMHLNQDQAKALLPLLKNFVKKGDLET